MPYLNKEDKKSFKEVTDAIASTLIDTPGELNYLFTEIAKSYLELNGESYQRYNDLLGALEGAKLELYRRKVSTYENKKIEENGDVY